MQAKDARDSAGRSAPFASVVVCTRDRPYQLRACLEAIGRMEYPNLDVLVVDNAPATDATERVVRDARVRYVVELRTGLSRARNRGIAASEGDIIVFLDDDALPHPGWLKALALEFQDPQVMAAGGRVVPVPGQDSSEESGRLRGSYRGGLLRRVVTRDVNDWFAQTNFGALGIGTNMAFRRSVLRFWKGFDERLGRGTALEIGEETYAFACIVKAGYKVVYTPDALVEHPFSPPMDELVARRLRTRSAITAYITFLLVEEPEQALQLLQYLVRRLLHAPIEWRESVASPQREIVPRWRAALALAYGPVLYFRQLLTRDSR